MRSQPNCFWVIFFGCFSCPSSYCCCCCCFCCFVVVILEVDVLLTFMVYLRLLVMEVELGRMEWWDGWGGVGLQTSFHVKHNSVEIS